MKVLNRFIPHALIVPVLLALAASPAQAAITITRNTSANALAAAVAAGGGAGLTVTMASLATHTQGATNASSGIYTLGSVPDTYGLVRPGVVLASGNVSDYQTGPNTVGNKQTSYGSPATAAQELLLDPISTVPPNMVNYTHNDVTQLNIEFTADANTTNIFFDVVFASEEYAEFVGSNFKDAFGLYLNGVNIAFLGGLPINIDHPGMTNLPGTEADGVLTIGGTNAVIRFTAPVIPGSVNNILTFIVGDTSDSILDTVVYISALGGKIPDPPCSVICSSNLVVSTDANQCSATVNYAPPTTTFCPGASVSCTPASGSVFSKGETTVNCTITTETATNTCSFTVTVNDTQAPALTCPTNLVISTDAGLCSAESVIYDVTATDNCPGVTNVCTPASGSTFPTGVTTVNCVATDAAGNVNTCSFTVTVEDKEAPHAICQQGPNPAGNNIPGGKRPAAEVNPDGFFRLLAADNCDENPSIFIKDSASAFVAGPFKSGDVVKITQNPGGHPKQAPGPGVIVAHIHFKGDGLLYATDSNGNISEAHPCNVPPKGGQAAPLKAARK